MAERVPKDWPHAAFAREVKAAHHTWWVIDTGQDGDPRPAILMLHGAGGSGHSFRDLIPLLAKDYRLIVPDLPGQGLTRANPGARFSLPAMSRDMIALCKAMQVKPDWIIGHSAGAAIALEMAAQLPLCGIIGINAALGKFEGVSGILFPMMARMLALLPLVPQAVSRLWGTPATVDRLLRSTGSQIDPDGRAQYLALVQRADHVGGTLGMMAAWDLDGLNARLPHLDTPVLFIASGDDRAVPSRISQEAAGRMPKARLHLMPNGGHLVHEVWPSDVAELIRAFVAETAR